MRPQPETKLEEVVLELVVCLAYQKDKDKESREHNM